MTVKFNKQVTVDYHVTRSNDVVDKTFFRNEVVDVAGIEENIRNFTNFHFTNGDIAIDIPKTSYTIVR